MVRIIWLGTSCLLMSCIAIGEDGDKDDEDEDEVVEGQTQGDCLDGEDNDGDGNIDCNDSGCSTASACSYEGGYDIDRCDEEVVSTGYGVGDIAYDFELMDQYGEMVQLSDFCNKVVLLEASAFW